MTCKIHQSSLLMHTESYLCFYSSVLVNPQDIAPTYAGSVFGEYFIFSSVYEYISPNDP